MVLNEITQNGNYNYIGFMVSKPASKIDEKEKKVAENIILFKKGNNFYFVKNTSILGCSEEKGYGVFQDFVDFRYIMEKFNIEVTKEGVSIVLLNAITPEELKKLQDSQTEEN